MEKKIKANYTTIPNKILEALAQTDLCKYEIRILVVILRKTYGWHKETDWISLSQYSERSGIAKSHVSRTIKQLENRNIILRDGKKRIGLQEDTGKWIKKVTSRGKKSYQSR